MEITITLGWLAKNQISHQVWVDSFRLKVSLKISKKAFLKMAKELASLELFK